MTVLVLGRDGEEQAAFVLDRLRERGRDAEPLDSRWFPEVAAISFHPRSRTGSFRLPSGRSLSFKAITSIYWRSYDRVSPPQLPDQRQSLLANEDSRSLFESVLAALPTRWVNGWLAHQISRTRPMQLAIVATLGVPIPTCMVTNNERDVLAFGRRHGQVLFKPVQDGARARRLSPRHLSHENLSSLQMAPILLQHATEGSSVRVFIAGERLCACRSDAPDFPADGAAEVKAHDLPKAVEKACHKIAAALALTFAAIDFQLTPQGHYVFVGADPSPTFVAIERAAGLPLTENLLSLLT